MRSSSSSGYRSSSYDDYDDYDRGGSSSSSPSKKYGYESRSEYQRYQPAADDCAVQCDGQEGGGSAKRVQMRKYCAMDYVYLVTVIGKERADNEWTGFKVQARIT